MEAIRISCAGYPTRRTFNEFIQRFGILVPNGVKGRYSLLERGRFCYVVYFYVLVAVFFCLLIFLPSFFPSLCFFGSSNDEGLSRRLLEAAKLEGYQVNIIKMIRLIS